MPVLHRLVMLICELYWIPFLSKKSEYKEIKCIQKKRHLHQEGIELYICHLAKNQPKQFWIKDKTSF